MLSYGSIDLVINGIQIIQLWAVRFAIAGEFLTAAVGLCCARNAPVCCLTERRNNVIRNVLNNI